MDCGYRNERNTLQSANNIYILSESKWIELDDR